MKRGSKRKTYKRKTYKRKTYKKSYKKSDLKEINKKRKSKKRKSKKRKLIGGEENEAEELCGGSPPRWKTSKYKSLDECIIDIEQKLELRAEAEAAEEKAEAAEEKAAAARAAAAEAKAVEEKAEAAEEKAEAAEEKAAAARAAAAEAKAVEEKAAAARAAAAAAAARTPEGMTEWLNSITTKPIENLRGKVYDPTKNLQPGINQYQGPTEMFPGTSVKYPYMASMADAYKEELKELHGELASTAVGPLEDFDLIERYWS